jgi:hypothetical protein
MIPKGILVCVDYADILAVTLPYNRHHFRRLMVVTTPGDKQTARLAHRHQADVYKTDAFYDDGAHFNKWKALEQGLDRIGRTGLMCILDADILWPSVITPMSYQHGYLYTPPRRVLSDVTKPIPPEGTWHARPLFNDTEWAGYTQLFYANDPVLPTAPWHQTDWIHAGGADSFFQALWPRERKLRPGFTVLHLGAPGANWVGRASQRVDGSMPAESASRRAVLRELMAARSRAPADDPYRAERRKRPPDRWAEYAAELMGMPSKHLGDSLECGT